MTQTKTRQYMVDTRLSEFTLSIVALQRLAFAAVYYSYEDFLIACFMRARGISDYRIGNKFSAELAATYSKSIADDVWSDEEVKLARLVRHAIVHNGCRETKELQKLGHGIHVDDGFLQITAPFVRAEFNSLKARASRLLHEITSRTAAP